jgi:L-fuconolactonase
VIDAHHHLWDPSEREYPWMTDAVAPIRRRFDIDDLRSALPAEIAATIVVQAVSAIDETLELLRIAGSNHVIAGVVGWVDLTADDAADQIALLRASAGGSKLMGVRHQVEDEADPHWLLREDVLRGLRAVADAGLVYDLLVREPQFAAAVEAVRRVPELQFVLDHAGKPPIARGGAEPWSTELHKLAVLPNVACKLSGFVTEAVWSAWTPQMISTYMAAVVDAFGPNRVMYGSDWPVCLLAYESLRARAIRNFRSCGIRARCRYGRDGCGGVPHLRLAP